MVTDQGALLPDDHRERRKMHPSHVNVPGIPYPKYVHLPSGIYLANSAEEESALREKESEC